MNSKNQQQEPNFYTPRQLADRLMVQPQTMTRWIREGRIYAIRAGREWRIPPPEYKRVLDNGVPNEK